MIWIESICSRFHSGFEHPVAEPGDHDVADRLLADEMVYPVDLVFVGAGEDALIERFGRVEVFAERLLHHQTPECLVGRLEQPGLAEVFRDHGEEARRHREVEDGRAGFAAEFGEPLGKAGVAGVVVEIALLVEDALRQPGPRRILDMVLAELGARRLGQLFDEGPEVAAELGVVAVDMIDAEDLEAVAEQPGVRQVVEGRNQQTLGQVAAGAEDDQGARRGGRGAFHSR